MAKKRLLIVGSGLAGLCAAITACEAGARALMISPLPSERAQSVMAAGGINAALGDAGDDSPELHAADTMRSGANIACEGAVLELCKGARAIVEHLEKAGMVFTRDGDGRLALRMMAGQSRARTLFSGSCTGKQLVSAVAREARKYEADDRLTRRSGSRFVGMLMSDSACCGGVFYDERTGALYGEEADATILCTGGMNMLFGKTTGSVLCDGSATAAVFEQGARLKNLEMIQYHPTTIITPQKQMLITEAARGEGGRLFYIGDDGARAYFMEDKYGASGNLQTRDVVSREVYAAGRQVYLDISFLGEERIDGRLREVKEVCGDYLGLDVRREPIPVSPCAHYFMGGVSVGLRHDTSIPGLYAAGECASAYHGANRLGGNSLLGALYGGRMAALHAMAYSGAALVGADRQVEAIGRGFFAASSPTSSFPSVYILNTISEIMNTKLGIVREKAALDDALNDLGFYLDKVGKIKFDMSDDPFNNYIITKQLRLAYAIVLSALARNESRGAHCRSDFPTPDKAYERASYARLQNGRVDITFEKDVGQP